MIKTLLITGENNHDWRRSSPFCKDLLEATGRFSVDLTENPATTLTDAAALRQYQLLFLDYNGPDWGEPAKANFAAAVEGGTGVVVLHAANNAFAGWTEYEKIMGLALRPGPGTSHAPFHELRVAIIDHDHPVTRGMNDFTTWDELYHRPKIVNPQDIPVQVLAAAYDDPAIGGSGRFESVMAVLEYGQGRVFHSLIGHVWPGVLQGAPEGGTMMAFENPGFQRVLIRGCEWAATGKVSS